MLARRLLSAGIGAMAAAVAASAHADVRVQGIDDDALMDRVEAVLPDTEEPDNRVEARRMARDAARRIEALLRSQGYYGATIEPRAEGDETFEAVVVVDLGPRFTVESVTYAVDGDMAAQTVALPSPAQDAIIGAGDPLLADDVLEEEATAVARVRLGGYPDAAPLPRRVVVDHATQMATVTYNIDAGRPAQFGELTIDSDADIRPRWAQRLVPFEPGDPYTPEDMETLSTRLSSTGAFDTVSVRLAPSVEGEGVERRNVIADITQGDRHTIELGAGYGTSEGARLEAEWARRNMFGGAETLTLAGVAATLERSARVQIRAPHFGRPNRTATGSVEGIDEETDAYDRLAGILAAGVEQPLNDTLVAALGVSLERSRVEDLLTGRRDFNIATAHGELRYDSTDDLLDPHNGLRGAIRLEPGVAAGDESLTFARAILDVSAYRQISGSPDVVLAARTRMGTIYGASAEDLPAHRRFYAGGGGSVRGYAYQSLGPHDALDNPLGGRSLLEMSAEARFRVTQTWGGVAFVDAGTTRRGNLPAFDSLSVGAGVGVRYYTAFGPIRADVGIPLTKREGDRGYQFYLSIGQSF
jgi:translocation and assembly module TamA